MKTIAILCLLFGLSWCTPVEREKRRVFEQTCLTSADCDAFNHECVIRDGDGYGQCVTTSRSKFSTDVETHSEDTSYISVPANVRPQDIESVVRNDLDRNNDRKKRSPHDGNTELSPDQDPHGPSGIETDVDDPEHVRHSKVDLMTAHPLCTGDKCKTDDDKSDKDHTVEKRSAKSSVLQNLESYSPNFAEQKDFENIVAPANVGSVLNKKDQATFDNRVKKRDVEDDDDENDDDDDDEEDGDDDDDDIGSDDERGPDDSDEDEDDSDDVEDVKVEPKKGGFTDYLSELFRGKRDNKNRVSNMDDKRTRRDTGSFDIEELLDELNGKSDEDDLEEDDDDYYYDDNDDDYEAGGDDDYGDNEEGLERRKRFAFFGNEDDNKDDDYNDEDDYDEDDDDEDDDEDDDYEYDDNDNEVKEELNESELLSLLSRKKRGSYNDYAGDDEDEDNDDDDNDSDDNEGDGDDYEDGENGDDEEENQEDEEYDNVEEEDGDYDDEKADLDEDEEQKLADLIGMLSSEKRSVSNTHDKTLSVAKRNYDDYDYEDDDNDNDEEYNDDDDDEDYDDGEENDEGNDYDQNGYADVEDESELLSLLSRKKRNVDNDYDEDEDDYDDYDEENDEYDDEEDDDDNDDDDEETGGFNPIDDSELLALLTRGQRKKRGLRNYDDDNYFDSNVEDSYNLKPFPVPLPVSHRRKMGHRPPAVPIIPGLNWTKVSTGPEPSTNRNNTRQSKRAVAAGSFAVKKNDMYNRANEDVDDTDEILIDSDFLDDHTSTDTGVETKTRQLGKSDAFPREKRYLGYRPEDESGGENGLVKEAKAFEEIDGDPNSGL